jgi:dienelactone hydrolase
VRVATGLPWSAAFGDSALRMSMITAPTWPRHVEGFLHANLYTKNNKEIIKLVIPPPASRVSISIFSCFYRKRAKKKENAYSQTFASDLKSAEVYTFFAVFMASLQVFAAEAYEKSPKPTVGDWKLILSTPTLKVYKNNGTILVSVRGTFDAADVKADSAIAVNALATTQRYKQDEAMLRNLQQTLPPEATAYYGVGHSLGGAILDDFLQRGLVKAAVSYNPAVQPKDWKGGSPHTRIYQQGDPLYEIMGRFTAGSTVVPASELSLLNSILVKLPYVGSLLKKYLRHSVDTSFHQVTPEAAFEMTETPVPQPAARPPPQQRAPVRYVYDATLGRRVPQPSMIGRGKETILDDGAQKIINDDKDVLEWTDDDVMKYIPDAYRVFTPDDIKAATDLLTEWLNTPKLFPWMEMNKPMFSRANIGGWLSDLHGQLVDSFYGYIRDLEWSEKDRLISHTKAKLTYAFMSQWEPSDGKKEQEMDHYNYKQWIEFLRAYIDWMKTKASYYQEKPTLKQLKQAETGERPLRGF